MLLVQSSNLSALILACSRTLSSIARQATRRWRRATRHAAVALLAALSLALTASPAAASITIGQLLTAGADYSGNTDFIQPTVTSGTPFVVPVEGTMTSWSHNAAAGANQTLTMKVFRKSADPSTYTAIAHDGPRPLIPSMVNNFPVSIPVKRGDLLGLNTISPVDTGAATGGFPGDTWVEHAPGLVDGGSGDFSITNPNGVRLNISATIEPSNSFTLGGVKDNTRNGTATLTVDVPNPGELTASGKGVKAASSKAVISATVTSPGAAKLLVKASGKKKRKLNETGKVKLRVAVRYTPTGGQSLTQSTKVRLKKH